MLAKTSTSITSTVCSSHRLDEGIIGSGHKNLWDLIVQKIFIQNQIKSYKRNFNIYFRNISNVSHKEETKVKGDFIRTSEWVTIWFIYSNKNTLIFPFKHIDRTGLVLLSMLPECFWIVPTFSKVCVCLYLCHVNLIQVVHHSTRNMFSNMLVNKIMLHNMTQMPHITKLSSITRTWSTYYA